MARAAESRPHSRPEAPPITRRSGLTPRAVVVTILLIPPLCLATHHSELVLNGNTISGNFPPMGAVLMLLLLVSLGNTILARLVPRAALSRQELLLIYSGLVVAGGMPSFGFASSLFCTLTGTYYATPANGWEALFFNYIPDWITVKDQRLITYYFEGLPGYMGVPYREWLTPLAAWLVFAMALFFALMCLASIFRRPWVERERLVFPLIQVPLAMTEQSAQQKWPSLRSPFFANRAMWLAALVPIVLYGLKEAAVYFPAIPSPTLQRISLDPIFTQLPWRAMRPFGLSIYFSLIGLTFFLPTDISFSFWFFYVLTKLQKVLGTVLGYGAAASSPNAPSSFPYLDQQGGGAYLVLFAVYIWVARHHMRDVLRKTFCDAPEVDDETEPMRYRTAIIGFVLSYAFLVGWCRASGMAISVAVLFFALYFVYCFVLTRVVVEGGIMWSLAPLTPDKAMAAFAGSKVFSPQTLTAIAHQMVWVRKMRWILPPSLLQTYRLMPEMRISGSRLNWLLLFILGFGAVFSSYNLLRVAYARGVVNFMPFFVRGYPRFPYIRLANYLQNPGGPDPKSIVYALLGAAFTGFLAFMRARFTWWPFHPLGYAFAGTEQYWLYNELWFSVFLAWVCKFVVLRYGGHALYQKTQRLFVGFIMGEFIIIGIAFGIDAAMGTRGNKFLVP